MNTSQAIAKRQTQRLILAAVQCLKARICVENPTLTRTPTRHALAKPHPPP